MTSAAEAATLIGTFIAALKRCAIQKQNNPGTACLRAEVCGQSFLRNSIVRSHFPRRKSIGLLSIAPPDSHFFAPPLMTAACSCGCGDRNFHDIGLGPDFFAVFQLQAVHGDADLLAVDFH